MICANLILIIYKNADFIKHKKAVIFCLSWNIRDVFLIIFGFRIGFRLSLYMV